MGYPCRKSWIRCRLVPVPPFSSAWRSPRRSCTAQYASAVWTDVRNCRIRYVWKYVTHPNLMPLFPVLIFNVSDFYKFVVIDRCRVMLLSLFATCMLSRHLVKDSRRSNKCQVFRAERNIVCNLFSSRQLTGFVNWRALDAEFALN